MDLRRSKRFIVNAPEADIWLLIQFSQLNEVLGVGGMFQAYLATIGLGLHSLSEVMAPLTLARSWPTLSLRFKEADR